MEKDKQQEWLRNNIVNSTKGMSPRMILILLFVYVDYDSRCLIDWPFSKKEKKELSRALCLRTLFFSNLVNRVHLDGRNEYDSLKKIDDGIRERKMTDEDNLFLSNVEKYEVLLPLFYENLNKLSCDIDDKTQKDMTTKWYNNLNWIFFIVFVLVLVFVGYIVFKGWATKPTVNIDFNVGEIIGGTLIGSGALLAGRAYANKLKNDNPNGPNDDKRE